MLEYKDGKRYDYTITPADFGLEPVHFEAFSAHHADESIQIAEAMLNGVPQTLHYQLVAANAAFIYTKFIEAIPLTEAFEKMQRLVFTGAMGDKIEQYKAAYAGQQHEYSGTDR
ncbi:MAG: hypothetical protein IT269_07940 [Saprospiraceae bacterium]|nr:hypothetical protein [Saprospiraceae bacterium]